MSVLLESYNTQLLNLETEFNDAKKAFLDSVQVAEDIEAAAWDNWELQRMYMQGHVNNINGGSSGASVEIRPFEFYLNYTGSSSGSFLGGNWGTFWTNNNDIINTGNAMVQAAKSYDAAKKERIDLEAKVDIDIKTLSDVFKAAKDLLIGKIEAFESAYLTGVSSGLTDEQAAAAAAAAAAALEQQNEQNELLLKVVKWVGFAVGALVVLYGINRYLLRSKS